jgi:hypothetical protein
VVVGGDGEEGKRGKKTRFSRPHYPHNVDYDAREVDALERTSISSYIEYTARWCCAVGGVTISPLARDTAIHTNRHLVLSTAKRIVKKRKFHTLLTFDYNV